MQNPTISKNIEDVIDVIKAGTKVTGLKVFLNENNNLKQEIKTIIREKYKYMKLIDSWEYVANSILHEILSINALTNQEKSLERLIKKLDEFFIEQ